MNVINNNIIGDILTNIKNEISGIMTRIKLGENYGIICNQFEGYNKSMLDFIYDKNYVFFDTWFDKIYNYLITPLNNKIELERLLETELFYNRYLNHYVVDNIYDMQEIKKKENSMMLY